MQKIIEAEEYAPNAGGGQRIRNKQLAEQIGILNLARFDRSRLIGSYVSKEQPGVIDDKNIINGFYVASCVCIIFTPKNPNAFGCAENMVPEATELGISFCITAKAEETFDNDNGRKLLNKWDIPEGFIARAFVLLGYCEGEYPKAKPRREGRVVIFDED